MRQIHNRLKNDFVPSSEVLEIGASALEKLDPKTQAFIRRQILILQETLKPMGPIGALEIMTALAVHLAKKHGPQQVTSAAGTRRA